MRAWDRVVLATCARADNGCTCFACASWRAYAVTVLAFLPIIQSLGTPIWEFKHVGAVALPPHTCCVGRMQERRARVTKRDAKCDFDQLRLPKHLHPWLGRPSLDIGSILRYTDMDIDELRAFLPHGCSCRPDITLWPLCTTWPVGFA